MSTRDAALSLAGSGWRIIPIWWIAEYTEVIDGEEHTRLGCACGNPLCVAPGKHPLIKMGRKLVNASSDLRVVSAWWDTWPNANVAVACGKESGVIVVDCDTKTEMGGVFEFEQWLAGQNVEIPTTLTAETGGGGRHFIFQYPTDGIPVKNCVAWLPDVDIKSDGGYILVEPSIHRSGNPYRWLNREAIAPLPIEAVNSIRITRSGVGQGNGEHPADAPAYDYRQAIKSGPRKGSRDHFFNARAFELRKGNVDRDAAIAELHRSWGQTEGAQDPSDPYPWDAVLDKVNRIWEEVEPDNNIPDWDPFAASTSDTSGTPKAIIVEGQPHDLCTDLGNAWRLVTKFRDEIRYTKALGWLVWDGVRWTSDDNDRIMELARATVDDIFEHSVRLTEDSRDKMFKWAQVSSNRPRFEAMVKLTNTFTTIKAPVESFDANPWLLACPNGTLDLRTGELRASSRADLITKRAAVEYDPGAYDPLWVQYLEDATNHDQELIAYLRRAAGYTLTGLTSEEVLFILYGPKQSGKTTFISAISTILGDFAMSTQPENLMHRKGNRVPQDEIARMRGKRLITSVEPQHGDRFAEGLIKQMTGGDKMSGRFLYKDTFEFLPTHKLWLATNTKPRAGADEALFRRLKLVLFPVTIPMEKKNPNIKAGLLDPTSNISRAAFAWAMQGCLEWQQQGLGTAAIVEEQTQEYQRDEDTIGQFIDECVEATDDIADQVAAREIYTVYRDWTNERGEFVMTFQSFNKALDERGLLRIKGLRTATFGKLKMTRGAWTGGL